MCTKEKLPNVRFRTCGFPFRRRASQAGGGTSCFEGPGAARVVWHGGQLQIWRCKLAGHRLIFVCCISAHSGGPLPLNLPSTSRKSRVGSQDSLQWSSSLQRAQACVILRPPSNPGVRGCCSAGAFLGCYPAVRVFGIHSLRAHA